MATQRTEYVRSGAPGVRGRLIEGRMPGRSDDEDTAVVQADRRTKLVTHSGTAQLRDETDGRAVARTDARPGMCRGVVLLRVTAASGDALKEVVREHTAVGQLDPSLFVAAI